MRHERPRLAILVLAATALGVVAPLAAAPPTAFSAADADALAQKLDALFRRSQLKKPPREKTVTVSEPELNSYLNLTLGSKLPKGVSDLVVHFEPDRLAARGLVDLAEVQGKVPTGSLGGILGFLSGKVPLEARGRLDTAGEGFSTFAIEQVTLSTFPVPVSLVEQLVTSATRSASNPEGFDIHSPFRLPYDLKRVRLEQGKALLEY